MGPTVIILRGVPGAGKSSLAETLCNLSDNVGYVEADTYMLNEEGDYEFDVSRLAECHNKCKQHFEAMLEFNYDLIIVSNTNTSDFEMSFYKEKAREYGYVIFYLVVENRHGNSSVHGVPKKTVESMKRRLMDNILL